MWIGQTITCFEKVLLVEISIYTNQSKNILGCGEGALTLENGKYPYEYIYIYNRNKILLRVLSL